MKSFEAKKPGEGRTYTCAFTRDLPAGVTINQGGCSVTASVYDKSNPAFPDDAPADIIDGIAVVNADTVTVLGRTVIAGQALSQAIKGGVAGCTYVLTFIAPLSSGGPLQEDVLLPVSRYSP